MTIDQEMLLTILNAQEEILKVLASLCIAEQAGGAAMEAQQKYRDVQDARKHYRERLRKKARG